MFKFFPLLMFGILPINSALAQEHAPPCVDIAKSKEFVSSKSGKWIELTHDQWEFMRGVYILDPQTPPGLPYGDKAFLVTFPDSDGGVVFFVDKDKACTPIPMPKQLIDILQKIGSGEINSLGDPT